MSVAVTSSSWSDNPPSPAKMLSSGQSKVSLSESVSISVTLCLLASIVVDLLGTCRCRVRGSGPDKSEAVDRFTL